MNTIQFSIIIPHKNIPSLLQRCLDSLPLRDDVQIIIVDDNSDPEKVDFENFPGINRPNTEVVFTREGKGAGYARNVGLQKAQGVWVLFADADDYFNYCFNRILDDYKDSQCDVVFFNASSQDTDKYVNASRGTHIVNAHKMDDSDPQKEFFFRYLYGEPWGKLIKRNLLEDNKIECEETCIHNDTQLSYLIGYYAHTVAMDDRAMYCVTSREGSVSRQEGDDVLFTRLNVFLKKQAFLKSKGIYVFEFFIMQVIMHYHDMKDMENLEKCFEVASQYGVSKEFLQTQIKTIKKDRRIFNSRRRVKSILKKVLGME